MKLNFECPSCGKPHSVDESMAGRRGRCKDCGTVMRIPGGSLSETVPLEPTPKPGPAVARAPAPSSAPSAARPRPTKPAPIQAAAYAAEVDDPYGLSDEKPAPRPTPLYDAAIVEDDLPPPPRAGYGDPVSNDDRGSRGDEEGPWGLIFRQGAMGLMALTLVLLRVMRFARRAHQEEAMAPNIYWGIVVLAALASVLSAISVIGAAISFARGNREAFSGESTGTQVGWVLSVVASVLITFFFLRGNLNPNSTTPITVASTLSDTEKADVSAYEQLVLTAIGLHNSLSMTLESLPAPDSPDGPKAWADLAAFEVHRKELDAHALATPPPTQMQEDQLFQKHQARYRWAVNGSARAASDAQARLNPPPDSEFGKSLQRLVDESTEHQDAYNDAMNEADGRSTGWYFSVFGKDAGSRSDGPKPPPMTFKPPVDAPAFDPSEASSDVEADMPGATSDVPDQALEEMRR